MMSTATVTILFTDLEASTELLQKLGDKDARLLWRTYYQLLRSAVSTTGGHQIKSLGDGLMIVFPSARDAIRCATVVQREIHRHNLSHRDSFPLNVRVGLHIGEPIQEEEDYFGTPVVIAKRICDCARGGQIFVSELVQDIVSVIPHIDFIDRGFFRLKGIEEQWRLYEIPWQREETPASFALSTLAERTPFVDRKKEFAELADFLEQARRGNGNLVLLGGEPGVGKTRLAEEIIEEARQHGFLTLLGHCYEVEGTSPYLPFLEILESVVRKEDQEALLDALGDSAPEVAKLMPSLRRIFPAIPPPVELPPEQARRSLFGGICEFMERASKLQPLLLVVEDLQWADDASLSLLQHIAKRLPDMAILILGTYRDVDLDVARSLAKNMQDLLRQRLAYRLNLVRLSEADVAVILRSRSGYDPPPRLLKMIYGETEGNPFFVEEIFKHLTETGKLFDAEGRWSADIDTELLDIPQGLKLVIGQRLKRLSEECRQVLTAAAVIGRGFSFQLLKNLADVEEDVLFDAVEAAEQAQLISSIGKTWDAQYVFSHELIRQTLVGSLSLPRRQRLHLRIAEAMERVYEHNVDEYAADLAYHYFQAGAAADRAKTVHYLKLAGDRSFYAAAFEEALRLHEAALSLQSRQDERKTADLLYRRGLDFRSLGRLEEAVADWNKALDMYERLGDIETVGRFCVEFSTYLFSIAKFSAAFETANRGLKALGDRVCADRCLLLAAVGCVLGNDQETGFEKACGFFDQALAMAEELKDERLLGPILGRKTFLHHAYWQGWEAADTGIRGGKLSQSHDPYGAVYPLAFGQCGLFWAGRFEDCERTGKEAMTLATRAGNEHVRWFIGHYDSFRELAVSGDLVQFEKRREELLELELRLGIGWPTLSYTQLGLAQFWRGLWEEARSTLQKGVKADIRGHTAGLSDSLLFLIAAYSQDKKTALSILEKRRTLLPQAGQSNMSNSWQVLDAAVEGLAVLDEREEAALLYPLALEAVATRNLIHATFSGLVQKTAAIAAAAGKLWDQAEEHYQKALQQAHEVPYKIEQPEVRRWYADMLIQRNAAGDKKRAGSLLTEAVAEYKEFGMPKHVEIAERLMKRL